MERKEGKRESGRERTNMEKEKMVKVINIGVWEGKKRKTEGKMKESEREEWNEGGSKKKKGKIIKESSKSKERGRKEEKNRRKNDEGER